MIRRHIFLPGVLLLICRNIFAQMPPVFVHQTVHGEVKLAETRNWATHIDACSLLRSHPDGTTKIQSKPPGPELSYSLQQIDLEESALFPPYSFTTVYRLERTAPDSLCFKISGDSDFETFTGTVRRSLVETRKYGGDSLLREITVLLTRYRIKEPLARWEYLYEDKDLKRVLIQQYDSLTNSFASYKTLEWVYDPDTRDCLAYLEYPGPPQDIRPDSIASWKNRLKQSARSGRPDFNPETFYHGGETIRQFYFFESSRHRITYALGYEEELSNLYETSVAYTRRGNIRRYEWVDHYFTNTLKARYAYNGANQVRKQKETIKGKTGRPKYKDRFIRRFSYDKTGKRVDHP